jgi:hypothetical protein
MGDRLAIFIAFSNQQLLPHRTDCAFQLLYHLYIPSHVGSWEALPGDERICTIIQYEPLKPEEVISTKNNKIPEGLIPLESSFSLSIGGNNEKEEESQLKVVESISMNIRTPGSSSNIKINIQGSDREEMKFVELLSGFQKVFSWFNVGLRGFDPGLVQYIMKTNKQKQILVNSELEETFRRELRNSLRTEMFSFFHPEGVSNWEPASKTPDNFRTYTSLRTFRQAIIRNPFPPLNIEMFQQ